MDIVKCELKRDLKFESASYVTEVGEVVKREYIEEDIGEDEQKLKMNIFKGALKTEVRLESDNDDTEVGKVVKNEYIEYEQKVKGNVKLESANDIIEVGEVVKKEYIEDEINEDEEKLKLKIDIIKGELKNEKKMKVEMDIIKSELQSNVKFESASNDTQIGKAVKPSLGDCDPACKVYIGGLRDDANKYVIKDAFSRYGSVRNVWVARRPPGFAFVEMDDPRNAEDAVKGLNGKRICNHRVKVEMSNGASSGRGGGGGRKRSRSRDRGRRSRSRS